MFHNNINGSGPAMWGQVQKALVTAQTSNKSNLSEAQKQQLRIIADSLNQQVSIIKSMFQ